MEKGTRVRVTGGRKAKGVTGTVFWTGPDNYGEGLRVGVRGDDGETHWLNAEHLEKIEAGEDPGPSEAAEVGKGDRVSFSAAGETLEGEVFWIGENKYGPGQRLGVRDAVGETHWLDALRVTILEQGGGTGDGQSERAQQSEQAEQSAPPPGAEHQPPPPGPEDEPPAPDLEEPPPGYE